MPWLDAVFRGAVDGMSMLVVLCLAAALVLLVCIPVIPIAIIVGDVLLGIVDGIRDALSGRRGSAS